MSSSEEISLYILPYPEGADKKQQKILTRQYAVEILRRHLHLPQDHQFDVGRMKRGKPFLREFPDCHFNISDSSNFWAIAIGKRPLGLDIERIHYRESYLSLVKRWFGALEIDPELILDLSEKELEPSGKGQAPSGKDTDLGNLSRFIRMWTCKESLLKQVGCGLGKEMGIHQIRWENVHGKPVPYAMENMERLAFHTFMIQNGQISDFHPTSARRGDLVVTLCVQTGKDFRLDEHLHFITQPSLPEEWS